MGALDGPSAASNFDAAVAGRRGVCACRLTSNPLLSPYEYDGFVWDLACGSGSVSESLVDYAGSAGLKVGRVTNDIDPRRKALLVGDVRAVNYVELARRAMPFFVMLTATCTSLSNAAHVYRAPGAAVCATVQRIIRKKCKVRKIGSLIQILRRHLVAPARSSWSQVLSLAALVAGIEPVEELCMISRHFNFLAKLRPVPPRRPGHYRLRALMKISPYVRALDSSLNKEPLITPSKALITAPQITPLPPLSMTDIEPDDDSDDGTPRPLRPLRPPSPSPPLSDPAASQSRSPSPMPAASRSCSPSPSPAESRSRSPSSSSSSSSDDDEPWMGWKSRLSQFKGDELPWKVKYPLKSKSRLEIALDSIKKAADAAVAPAAAGACFSHPCVHVHWEPRAPALMFVDMSMSDPLSVILDRVDADFFGAFPGWRTSMRSRLRLRAGWYLVSGHETLADVAIERLCFHFDLFHLYFSCYRASLIFESGLYDFDVFISP